MLSLNNTPIDLVDNLVQGRKKQGNQEGSIPLFSPP
jgi:hypothetical protein